MGYKFVKAPEDYPGMKYRGKYCQEHVLNYWKHYGIVPNEKEIIHHKDENKDNNDWTNLELKSRLEHSRYHSIEKGRTYVKLKCPGCDKIFIVPKNKSYLSNNNTVTCCSRKCIGKYCALSQQEQIRKIQEMFIEEKVVYKPIYFIN